MQAGDVAHDKMKRTWMDILQYYTLFLDIETVRERVNVKAFTVSQWVCGLFDDCTWKQYCLQSQLRCVSSIISKTLQAVCVCTSQHEAISSMYIAEVIPYTPPTSHGYPLDTNTTSWSFCSGLRPCLNIQIMFHRWRLILCSLTAELSSVKKGKAGYLI